jgi:hypothetical protein
MNIPEGFKLVPVEMTKAMALAYIDAPGDLSDAWRDMIAAAPAPPQPIYDEEEERELFEAQYLLTQKRWADGYADRGVNNRWKGWIACAQSRAKAGEDE